MTELPSFDFTLRVTTMLVGTFVLSMGAACSNGCTPSSAQTSPVVLAALTAADTACVDPEIDAMVIPEGTPLAVPAGDITIGCRLDNSKTAAVLAVVTAYVAAKAEAGAQAPAGMAYRPGPKALAVLFDGGGK